MPPVVAAGAFRSRPLDGAPGTWILEPFESDQPRLVIAGHVGPPFPETLNGLDLRAVSDGRWRLLCREGQFEFAARLVERLEPLPQLFDPLLAPHALRARDRARVGILLKLLRLPGGAWLLRAWHASRN